MDSSTGMGYLQTHIQHYAYKSVKTVFLCNVSTVEIFEIAESDNGEGSLLQTFCNLKHKLRRIEVLHKETIFIYLRFYSEFDIVNNLYQWANPLTLMPCTEKRFSLSYPCFLC